MKFTILEPMSTGDVIDRAVRLYRHSFTSLISIVAVPTLFGYVISLMFWYGYSNLVLNPVTQGNVPADAMLLMIVGMIGYPVWMFILLVTVCGLARVIGDNLMMDEPITFRRCFASVRGKIGGIIALGLLILAFAAGLYIVLTVVLIAVVMVVAMIIGAMTAMHLPSWMLVIAIVLISLVAVAALLFVGSFILARVVFLPQVLMIEGVPVGSALGRAMRLGKGNWNRVLAIILFTYFVSFSLLGAMTIVTAAILYFGGFFATATLTDPLYNILYTSFRDLANMLSLPIWIISFTLLYFDSRVRKEAYDIELLAREVAPGYVWQAPQPAFAGYYPPRQYVQTGPLGLGSYYPPGPPPPMPPPVLPTGQPSPPFGAQPPASYPYGSQPPLAAQPPMPQPPFEAQPLPPQPFEPQPSLAPPPFAPPATSDLGVPADDFRTRFEQAARSANEAELAGSQTNVAGSPPQNTTPGVCARCGNELQSGARFCNRCGTPTPQSVA